MPKKKYYKGAIVRHLLSRSIIDVIAKEHGILMSLQFIPGFWDRPLVALRAFVEN